MGVNSIINKNFLETEWIESIRRSLLNGGEIDLHGCIFRVPKPIKDLKPKSYTPQRMGFGPYHHLLPGPHMMQNLKVERLHALQKSHSDSSSSYVEELVNRISKKKGNVRAYYREELSIDDLTLNWIMVIDGLFLLQLIRADESSALLDPCGRKFLECSLWNDAVKIENQIPFFVLELLEGSRDALARKASVFCERVSPVESNVQEIMMKPSVRPFHLLHLLYTSVCFEVEEYPIPTQTQFSVGRRNRRAAEQKRLREDLNAAPNFNFLVVPRRFVVLATNILQLLGLSGSLQAQEENALLPSASELSGVKVKLCASKTRRGVSATEFKIEGCSTLVLPTLTLNFHSDVVIQNLLAYEAIVMPDSPVFNRYIEMMGAMIRTTQDVHQLKKEKILKHDGDAYEVVKLFEGFKDCIASEGQTALDGVIEEVNEHYSRKWKIKSKKFAANLFDSLRKMLLILVFVFFYFLIGVDIMYVAFPSLATYFAKLAVQEVGNFLTNLIVKIYHVKFLTKISSKKKFLTKIFVKIYPARVRLQ